MLEEYTLESYFDLGDDDSDGQDEADASAILAALSSWAPTYKPMTTSTSTTPVEPRPTIVNGDPPLSGISCASSTGKWVSADQFADAYAQWCGAIAGTE